MKINLVKLDESEYWNKEITDKVKNGKIYTVYIYNPNKHVHCCELTPSYELYFVGYDYCPKENLSEKEIENLDDNIRTSETEPVSYYHVHDIDRMPSLKKSGIRNIESNRGKCFLMYVKKEVDLKDEYEIANWCGENYIGIS